MKTVSLKCPNCGGGLQFDPASQKYQCEYCLSDFTQEKLEELLPEMREDASDAELSDGEIREDGGAGASGKAETSRGVETSGEGEAQAVVYTCPSCGAEIVTDETTAATFCFYCHNPVILQGRLDGAYEPDYVIPFAIEREKALEIFHQWLRRKRFVPNSFYAPDQVEKLSGVYFPYWMYSCEVDGAIDAEGTKLRVWNAGNLQYTETQKFDVSRAGTMPVNHLTRNALKKADRLLAEGVMPFDMKSLEPFSIGYLSGFMAEKRDMEHGEYSDQVEQEVREYAVNSLQSSINGYQSVDVRLQKADIRNARWDYALLPVWTLTYRDRKSDQVYYFSCNGQTGKVCGKLPIDYRKLGLFFAELFVPLFIVLMIVGYFL